MKLDHCLRPVFTEYVIRRLMRGDSINLYGPKGTGKTRLLEDIKKAEAGIENTFVLNISFRGREKGYEGFCRAIWLESGLQKEPLNNLNKIIEELKSKHEHIFLLIDDFQYFIDNPNLDPSYDQSFVDSLNSIKNTSGVSLLISTIEPANRFNLFIDQTPYTSMLYADSLELSLLQHKEIRQEIDGFFKADKLDDDNKNILATHLNEQKTSYALLEYYKPKILNDDDSELDFKTRLYIWDKYFANQNSVPIGKKIANAENNVKKLGIHFEPLVRPFRKLKTWIQMIPRFFGL